MTFACYKQQFPSEVKTIAEDDVEFLTIPGAAKINGCLIPQLLNNSSKDSVPHLIKPLYIDKR